MLFSCNFIYKLIPFLKTTFFSTFIILFYLLLILFQIFKDKILKEHQRLQKEYSSRLQDLERERQGLEEDKQQVERYKGLLLKQRDIMIALTGRLNDRDQVLLHIIQIFYSSFIFFFSLIFLS